MKRITYIAIIIITAGIAISSCDGPRREPGRVYMPDMAYSRAYESYAERDTATFTYDVNNKGEKIFYNNLPAAGSIKRGELFPYALPNDSIGYKLSAQVKNPYDSINISKTEMAEAGRLFNVNCGICHGAKGGGNGPIASAGHIGGVANLTAEPYISMADGTMFHSLAYGKNLMGSYASQLTKQQRWMIVKYIRTMQPKAVPAKTDSSAVAKK